MCWLTVGVHTRPLGAVVGEGAHEVRGSSTKKTSKKNVNAVSCVNIFT